MTCSKAASRTNTSDQINDNIGRCCSKIEPASQYPLVGCGKIFRSSVERSGTNGAVIEYPEVFCSC